MAMERKPQQQTLSIRITDTLRDFLERSRQVLSVGRGESVSTSDVAKILLESAKDDRLDSRLEVAELLQRPTESLSAIRVKWETKQPLSRAEWILIGQHVQFATEDVSENPGMPGPAAFIALLEAFLAVRSLRADRGAGLDRYYLGNLGIPDGPALSGRQFDPDLIPHVVARIIDALRQTPPPPKPSFVGRNFFVAVRDEVIEDVVALNRVLDSYVEALYRLAVRGHWMREKRPVRRAQEEKLLYSELPAVKGEGFKIAAAINSEGEVSIRVLMDQKDIVLPIVTYPEIREFAALLEHLIPERAWKGIHFYGHVSEQGRFYFRRRAEGIQFGFSAEEWQTLKSLFARMMEAPKLQGAFAELALVYGEL
jgi:hypothetical protein